MDNQCTQDGRQQISVALFNQKWPKASSFPSQHTNLTPDHPCRHGWTQQKAAFPPDGCGMRASPGN